jgi:hypothetical protein
MRQETVTHPPSAAAARDLGATRRDGSEATSVVFEKRGSKSNESAETFKVPRPPSQEEARRARLKKIKTT